MRGQMHGTRLQGSLALVARSVCRAFPTMLRAVGAKHDIRLICTDVDGTLLDSKQQLSPRVEAAVHAAAACGVPIVIATGKARGPWAPRILPRLYKDSSAMPGVFLQGLMVCDSLGNILHQQTLGDQILLDALVLADSIGGITSLFYSGTRVLSEKENRYTDILAFYSEPKVEAVGHLSAFVGSMQIQKVLFMAPQALIDVLRLKAEQLLAGRASLTSGSEGCLEVLPLGASKGTGVEWLLKHLGVEPQHVMALGDAENDVEMLKLAGLGVAVGNACPKALKAADVVVGTNNDDGVAEAIHRFVLAPRGLSSLAAFAAAKV